MVYKEKEVNKRKETGKFPNKDATERQDIRIQNSKLLIGKESKQ